MFSTPSFCREMPSGADLGISSLRNGRRRASKPLVAQGDEELLDREIENLRSRLNLFFPWTEREREALEIIAKRLSGTHESPVYHAFEDDIDVVLNVVLGAGEERNQTETES